MGRRTQLYRKMVLTLAANRTIKSIASRYGLHLGARRFVAGQSMADAIEVCRQLNKDGIAAAVDVLGEGIWRLEEAESHKEQYIKLLSNIAELGLDGNISIKPTAMGLGLDWDICYANIREIVHHAKELKLFVRLDMEDSPFTTDTLAIIFKLQSEQYDCVGVALQSSLYRTERDMEELTEAGIPIRLVKGAYKEPKHVAYEDMEQVVEQYLKLAKARLDSGEHTAFATHDDAIITELKEYAETNGISRDRYEFQMLYGVRMALQKQLADEGFRVRCYVPYGRMWYPYFIRRIAERPANAWFILRNMWK